MGKLAEHWVEIGARLAKFNAGMAQVEKRMASVGKKMTAVGKTMTRYVTLPIVAMGVLAVKAGADFEYAMTNAWAVTGEGEKALVSMTAKAREMGATTVFSAKQAADAMYFMASAGWGSKKMAEAIKPTLDLAAATQSDLAFATEAVIASMNQFQITTKNTQRVTDVFANAIMGSQATLEKLKISMTFIGPLAHAMGYEIEETTGALMGLYNAGYEASTAGTALRMGLAKLSIGVGATKEGLKGLGLSLEDVSPEMHSMTEIIRKLEERGATATDVIKIFGVRAGPAFAALIAQGSDALEENIEKTRKVGSGAEMAEKQIKTFKGSFKLLTSIINEACIQIFAVLGPIIKDLVDNKIRPAIKAFTELSDEKKKTILKIVGLVAALGPLLLIFGKMLIIIPKVATMIMFLGKALLWLAANPVVLLAAGLVYLATWLKKVEDAEKGLEAASRRLADAHKQQADRYAEVAKAAGLTMRATAELIRKYDMNYSAMFRAIKQGKEGKELQEAYIKTIARLKGEIEKETGALDGLTEAQREAKKKLDDMNEAVRKELELIQETEKATDAWAERLKALGVETIPEMEEEIETLTGEIGKLDEMFKTGKIGVTDYFNATRELREEIEKLREKIEETLPPARDFADVWDLMGPKIEGVKGKIEEVATTLKERFLEIADAVANVFYQIGELIQTKVRNQMIALDKATNAERDALDERYEAEKEGIENSLMSEEEKEEALEELEKEKYDAFAKFDEDYEKKKNAIAKKAFESHKKISLVTAAIDIASAIIRALPDFILAALAAAAGAVQLAVIASQTFPSLQEGGLIPRPMPVIAGHGPKGEIIAQPSKLAEIISREMPRVASPELAFAPATIQPIVNIYAQNLDRDTIRRAGEFIKNELDYQYRRGK